MQAVDTIGTETGAPRDSVRRARAHGRAMRHSAQVRLLRRIIPITAIAAILGIAGVVFYEPMSGLPDVGLGPISVSGTKVTMENPRLSGFRKGARGYEVTAATALQDVRKPALVELQAMKGRLATDDKGGLVHIEAKGGLFDSTKESLNLEQDIRLWTDKGEEVRLKSASVDFKAGSVRSSDPITVTVPSGSISADSLDVVESGKVISFVGNVRAVFRTPAKALADEAGPDRIRTSSADAAEAR